VRECKAQVGIRGTVLPPPQGKRTKGSHFKGGVNVCQRQLVNEVLGPLVTEFVPNFGREDTTPYQRGLECQPSQSCPGHQTHQTYLMRAPTSQRRPSARWLPVAHTRFKVVPARPTPRAAIGSSKRCHSFQHMEAAAFVIRLANGQRDRGEQGRRVSASRTTVLRDDARSYGPLS